MILLLYYILLMSHSRDTSSAVNFFCDVIDLKENKPKLISKGLLADV